MGKLKTLREKNVAFNKPNGCSHVRWRGAPKAFPTSHAAGCPTYPSLEVPGCQGAGAPGQVLLGCGLTARNIGSCCAEPRVGPPRPTCRPSQIQARSPIHPGLRRPRSSRPPGRKSLLSSRLRPSSTSTSTRDVAPPGTWRHLGPTIPPRDGGNQLLSSPAPCGSGKSIPRSANPRDPARGWVAQALGRWCLVAFVAVLLACWLAGFVS